MRCIEETTWFLALWSVYVKVSLNPHKNCLCRCIHASLCSFTSSASVNPEPDGTRACPATRRSATLLCWTCPKETVVHTAAIYHNSRVCVEGGRGGLGGGCLCVSSAPPPLLLKFLVMVSVHYFLIGFLFPVYFGYFMCVFVCVCRLLEVSAWGRQKGSWWMLLEACISCREAPKWWRETSF